jgi:ubiquitin C-terminal hydrolase
MQYDHKIKVAPPVLQIRFNGIKQHDPLVEQTINLKPFTIKQEDQRYELQRVWCRSGKNAMDAGGHFWFYEKNGDEWIEYNDKKISSIRKEEMTEILNKYSYSCFYYRQ